MYSCSGVFLFFFFFTNWCGQLLSLSLIVAVSVCVLGMLFFFFELLVQLLSVSLCVTEILVDGFGRGVGLIDYSI